MPPAVVAPAALAALERGARGGHARPACFRGAAVVQPPSRSPAAVAPGMQQAPDAGGGGDCTRDGSECSRIASGEGWGDEQQDLPSLERVLPERVRARAVAPTRTFLHALAPARTDTAVRATDELSRKGGLE